MASISIETKKIAELDAANAINGTDLLVVNTSAGTKKATVDQLVGGSSTSANIAQIESSATASRAYAVGDMLVYGGTLYKVTAAISAGNVLTVGGNIAATTVGSEITSLNNDFANPFTILSFTMPTTITNMVIQTGKIGIPIAIYVQRSDNPSRWDGMAASGADEMACVPWFLSNSQLIVRPYILKESGLSVYGGQPFVVVMKEMNPF